MIHIIPKLHNTRVCETMSIYLELQEITALLINGLQCEEDFGETRDFRFTVSRECTDSFRGDDS